MPHPICPCPVPTGAHYSEHHLTCHERQVGEAEAREHERFLAPCLTPDCAGKVDLSMRLSMYCDACAVFL